MNCKDAREWFSALLDGEIGLTERALVETHVTQCAECRRELEQLQKMVKVLHRVERRRAPLGFVGRVLERIRPANWLQRLRRRLPARVPLRVPAGAAAVLIVAVLAVYIFQRSPELQQAARQEAPPAPSPSVAPTAQPSPPPPPAPSLPPRAATPPAEPMPTQAARPLAEPTSPPPGPPVAAPRAVAPPRDEPMPTQASPPVAQPRSETRPLAAGTASPADAPPAAAPAPTIAAPSLSPPAAPAPPPAAREALADRKDKAEASKPRALEQSRQETRSKESAAHSAPSGLSRVPDAPSPPSFARKTDESPGTAPSPADRARQTEPTRPVPSPPPAAAKRALPSVDVVGRLSVKDRDVADRDLAALLARVRGTEVARQRGFSSTVVDAVVPQSSYGEFTQGLARIGAWQPEAGRSPLPDPVRVTIRVTE